MVLQYLNFKNKESRFHALMRRGLPCKEIKQEAQRTAPPVLLPVLECLLNYPVETWKKGEVKEQFQEE